MNIKELYQKLELEDEKRRLVFCEFTTQEGFQVANLEELKEYIANNSEPIYIMNESSNESLRLFDYFTMQRIKPYMVVVKHPIMTNAYYKPLPDKINDVYVSPQGNVFRYLLAKYHGRIQEYVIELPQNMDESIYKFLKKLVGNNFFKNNYKNTALSLVFTNSNRYQLFSEANFVILPYNTLYEDWDVKSITSANLSGKIWKDIKTAGDI